MNLVLVVPFVRVGPRQMPVAPPQTAPPFPDNPKQLHSITPYFKLYVTGDRLPTLRAFPIHRQTQKNPPDVKKFSQPSCGGYRG